MQTGNQGGTQCQTCQISKLEANNLPRYQRMYNTGCTSPPKSWRPKLLAG